MQVKINVKLFDSFKYIKICKNSSFYSSNRFGKNNCFIFLFNVNSFGCRRARKLLILDVNGLLADIADKRVVNRRFDSRIKSKYGKILYSRVTCIRSSYYSNVISEIKLFSFFSLLEAEFQKIY